VEKYGRAGQATDESITWRLRFTCWMNKATYIPSNYVKLLLIPGKNGYANMP